MKHRVINRNFQRTRMTMQSPEPEMKLQKILVPIDFSSCTAKTLQHAATLARQFGASITLLHVLKPNDPRVFEQLREAGETQLNLLAETLWGSDLETDVRVVDGKPFSRIVNEAKEMEMDLIVMGSHSSSTSFLHHKTLEKVMRNAPCPVLVVHCFDGSPKRLIDFSR